MTKNIIKIKKDEPIDIQLESDSILKNGYGLISRDVMRDKTLHPTAKAIYSYLNSFAGSKGICYPSMDLIRSELSLSKNTCDKYMRELKKRGLIKVFRIQNEENNLLSNNIYEIAMSFKTIEDNKKDYSLTKRNSLNKNNNFLDKSIVAQKIDKRQELLNSKIFTLEEVSKMSIEQIDKTYELIKKINKE